MTLTVLGRAVRVPCAAKGVARFSFGDLCLAPLAAADYLAIARTFHTILIDHIPEMTLTMRDAARRFTLLIDTLYDENIKLVCSAAVPPDRALYGRRRRGLVPAHGVAAHRDAVARISRAHRPEGLERLPSVPT